jgi:outer membrane protein
MSIGALLCASALHGAAADASSVAVVDLNRVFNDYFKTASVNTRIEEFATNMGEEREPLVTRYDEMQARLRAVTESSQDEEMPPEERRTLTTEAQEVLAQLRDLRTEIDEFDAARSDQLERLAKRLHEDIVDDIYRAVETYARRNDIDIVIDSAYERQTGLRVVVHSDPDYDITDEIIEQLNKGAPRTAAPGEQQAPAFTR